MPYYVAVTTDDTLVYYSQFIYITVSTFLQILHQIIWYIICFSIQ